MRYINDNKKPIIEGKLRCEELCEYLKERDAGTDIWIAEDGSGIVPKILYSPTLDELVGMTLPMDEITGCPKNTKAPHDAEEIKKFMLHTKSTLVYIIMAVPLKVRILE